DVYATTINLDDFSFVLNPEPVARFDNELTVLNVQHIFKAAADHTVRIGGEYRKSELPVIPLNVAEVSYDIVALSGMWEWQLRDDLTLTLAAREDQRSLKRRGPIPADFGLSNADWDIDLHVNSYNGALLWQVDARNVLRLNGGRGIQLPSLFNFGGSLVEFP